MPFKLRYMVGSTLKRAKLFSALGINGILAGVLGAIGPRLLNALQQLTGFHGLLIAPHYTLSHSAHCCLNLQKQLLCGQTLESDRTPLHIKQGNWIGRSEHPFGS